jgi:formylglycine-generating enzyme required for sulfatase activity
LPTLPAVASGQSAAMPPTFPPAQITHFCIEEEIGQGAMGRVFLARDTRLGRCVALKFLLHDDAASRERFAREARAVARLQHQNIVAIHDVAEHDGWPYLVEEYVGGASLAARPGPMPWRDVLALGLALADGLAAAHDSGVVHRDIKPANIMIAGSGTPKLVDFGLARLVEDIDTTAGSHATSHAPEGRELTGHGAILGTPYYMAPELWRGESATPASDVYSLGVVIHELCTGRVPHYNVPADALHQVVNEGDAPAVGRAVPGIDVRFADAIDRCLARTPDARFASGKELYEALAAIAATALHAARRSSDAGNPYPGLRAFEREQRAYFFGREDDVREVAGRLEHEHVLLIAGESGVGKSSLVRAGVLPWIVERGLAGISAWWSCTLLPDQHALAALGTALGPRLGMDANALCTALAQDLAAVGHRLQRVHGDDAGTVIFVDQLEQLVTLCAHDDAAAMAGALVHLAVHVPRVRVLATVRGDQLTRLVSLPGLGTRIERALYILRPLQPAQVREAVVRPAMSYGVEFASAGMVDTLVDAALGATGGLPLLQFALAQLWEHRDRERRVIPEAALAEIGGVAGALSRHADHVVDGLRSDRGAREVLLRLVLLHEARARHTEQALVDDDPERRKALEALVNGRLVVASESDGAPVYEVAHEALLTAWPRLRDWLDEESGLQAVQRRLVSAAVEWERLGRASEALWKARQLREAEGIRPDMLGTLESAFLQQSRRRTRRVRISWWVGALSVLALLAMTYVWVRYAEERRLRAEVDALLSEAAPHMEKARARGEAYRRERSDADEHLRRGTRTPGEEAWQRALILAPEVEEYLARALLALEPAFQRGSGRTGVRDRLAAALHEQALFAEAMGRDAELARLVARMGAHGMGELAERWTASMPVELTTSPPSLPAILYRYERAADGRLAPVLAQPARRTPQVWQLRPGSYLLALQSGGRAVDLRVPFRVAPGQQKTAPLSLHFDVPGPAQVPPGFIHVPAGSFLFGFGGEERLEPVRAWYKTVPPHWRHTGAFLIARHETTYEDWLEFLRSLPATERAARLPRATFDTNEVALSEVDGAARLRFVAVSKPYVGLPGQLIAYESRDRRVLQDWLRFPVTGISGEDAQAYLRWLDRTRRVPGARFCREDEWERAARGADARQYPHGDRLAPDDANFDATYGKKEEAYGFDQVGSHPASRSPFGVDDMVGNARELTLSVLDDTKLVVRGGDFFRSLSTNAIVNREYMTAAQRAPHVGLRVCADPPAPGTPR